ncbi:hypothetical protein NQU36_26755, partial [Escherichia coli]|uniref:hypothetical protein n=1 Tax=Escherichia coli TaxID=562 RepID=UPI0021177610
SSTTHTAKTRHIEPTTTHKKNYAKTINQKQRTKPPQTNYIPKKNINTKEKIEIIKAQKQKNPAQLKITT